MLGLIAAPITQGALVATDVRVLEPDAFVLSGTQVRIEVRGGISRARLTQTFDNPYNRPVEAQYVFPLPHDAAVTQMATRVNGRTIRAELMEKNAARARYARARSRGQRAALLTERRPNVFEATVGRIEAGARVQVELRYIAPLRMVDGAFSLVFPMVVGPRYTPELRPSLSPPQLPRNVRSGRDMDLEVSVDAGFFLESLRSPTHRLDINLISGQRALVRLADDDRIPNKDFELRFSPAAGAEPLRVVHQEGTDSGGYFSVMLAGRRATGPAQIIPRELVFLVDSSCSMRGAPLRAAQRLILGALDRLSARDTFRIIRFSDRAESLDSSALQPSSAALERARAYTRRLKADGGTRLLRGLRSALQLPSQPGRLRTIVLLSDGYIDQETVVFREVEAHIRDGRLFGVGIGSAVNRHLLDALSRIGRGRAHYALDEEDAQRQARSFLSLIERPTLSDLQVRFEGAKVYDLYPKVLPDLFGGRPVLIHGRYRGRFKGRAIITGKGADGGVRDLKVRLRGRRGPARTLWARAKIGAYEERLLRAEEAGSDAQGALTSFSIQEGVMCSLTAWVAVDKKSGSVSGADLEPLRVSVPVDAPAQTSGSTAVSSKRAAEPAMSSPARASSAWSGSFDGEALPRSVQRRIIKRIRGAYERSLKRAPKLMGRLEIELIFDPRGRIERVRIVRSTVNDPAFEREVLRLLRTSRIRPSGSPESRTLRFPIVFSPR